MLAAMLRRRGLPGLLLLAALVSVLAGCGSDDAKPAHARTAALLLDFQPNAVHTGIYEALAKDYDADEGIALRAQIPGASSDAVKLLAAGRVELAILDIHDLALARERGQDLVGVMAIVQRPLAAILAEPEIRTPRDLEGKRVGVTGLPSDDAVARSIVAGAGGDPDRLRLTTIGFEAVRSLLTDRVAGATAFWNAEGVALRAKRPDIREFRVDDYGAPSYPELVLTVTRATLRRKPQLVGGVVKALVRGYDAVVADPQAGLTALLAGNDALKRAATKRELDAVLPAFKAGARSYGELDAKRLRAWARWDKQFGIVKRLPDVAQAFDARFVPSG
jgi:putative hydroxymethylpyrimidine transport system substrate-binding protein